MRVGGAVRGRSVGVDVADGNMGKYTGDSTVGINVVVVASPKRAQGGLLQVVLLGIVTLLKIEFVELAILPPPSHCGAIAHPSTNLAVMFTSPVSG